MRTTTKFSLSHLACAFALILTTCTATNAGSISYPGPFSDLGNGGSTIYTDVVESSSLVPPARFGEPEAVGDVLDFDPSQNVFQALASDGSIDFIDVALSFDAMTIPTDGISSLLISEVLDYSFPLGGTADTRISAGINGVIVTVLEVNGFPVTPFNILPSAAVATRNAADDPAAGTIVNSVLVDVGAFLPNANDVATRIEVSLDDTLAAASEDNTVAFVRKKDFKISPGIEPNPVPEPATLALAFVSLAGLLNVRRVR